MDAETLCKVGSHPHVSIQVDPIHQLDQFGYDRVENQWLVSGGIGRLFPVKNTVRIWQQRRSDRLNTLASVCSMLEAARLPTIVIRFSTYCHFGTFDERDFARAMIDSETSSGWLSVAEASRAIGISETAVRKRIRMGTLPAREYRGRKEVLISVGPVELQGSQPSSIEFSHERSLEVARLMGELAELRARLEDAQRDRDRWHQLAMESRDEARAAEASRAAIERELRLLLART